jgi:ERCC4-type nuclease
MSLPLKLGFPGPRFPPTNKTIYFQSKIQILFSGSQAESAKILSALSAKESRKGHALPCPLRLTANAEKVLPFYQSLPGVGFGTALLLAANFKSVKDFVNAAQV